MFQVCLQIKSSLQVWNIIQITTLWYVFIRAQQANSKLLCIHLLKAAFHQQKFQWRNWQETQRQTGINQETTTSMAINFELRAMNKGNTKSHATNDSMIIHTPCCKFCRRPKSLPEKSITSICMEGGVKREDHLLARRGKFSHVYTLWTSYCSPV